MPYINFEGLTIIGDGSQWFWSMAAFLAIPVTGYLVYSQLRGQRSASAIAEVEAFFRESMSETMNRYVVEFLSALRAHRDPADLPIAATWTIVNFWEPFASLTRAGYRDPRVQWLVDPRSAQVVWAWLTPWAEWQRAVTGRSDILADLEWLAGLMADMDRRAGKPPVTPADVAHQTERVLAFRQELIRHAVSMRTVPVATPDPATVERPKGAGRRRGTSTVS